jgi:hypothetical protein
MEMAFYNISKLYSIVFSLIVLIIARYYLNENYLNQNDFTINNDSIERSIIKSWKNLVTLPIRNSNHNLVVAIGYNHVYLFLSYSINTIIKFYFRTNTNVDLILSGTELLNNLDLKADDLKNHHVLTNLKDFKECFK